MDLLSLLRTMGALGVVLGLLGGALWVVRRYNIALPGRVTLGRGRRLEVVERVTLDGKRSLALVRRDGCEHLILIGPDGQMVVESGIVPLDAPVATPVVTEMSVVPEAPAAAAEIAPEVEPEPEPVVEPEPDLRTALGLLLTHLQARRALAGERAEPVAELPPRAVAAMLQHLAEHHAAQRETALA